MHIAGQQDVLVVIDKNTNDRLEFFEQIVEKLELVDQQNGRVGLLDRRRIPNQVAHFPAEFAGGHHRKRRARRGRLDAFPDRIQEMGLPAPFFTEQQERRAIAVRLEKSIETEPLHCP